MTKFLGIFAVLIGFTMAAVDADAARIGITCRLADERKRAGCPRSRQARKIHVFLLFALHPVLPLNRPGIARVTSSGLRLPAGC